LGADERMIFQCIRQQLYCVLDFTETALAEPLFVQRVPTQKMLPQGLCGPNSELSALLGLNSIANRDDGIQAVKGDRFIGRSNVHILHIAISVQLTLGEDIIYVLCHDGALATE
jgi:hypothetical protein